MNGVLQVLGVTTPFFALVGLGWIGWRRGWLPMAAIPGMNTFVLWVALPCMLYRFGASTPIERLLDPAVALTWGLAAAAIVALTIATTRRGAVGWNDASFGALVAAFPNSGFVGVPVVVALLGAQAAGPVIVTVVVDMVITTSVCIALSRIGAGHAGEAVGRMFKGMLTNPLPWAIVLGVLASATAFQLPAPGARLLGLLADAASPVALFTLGGVLARSAGAGQAQHGALDEGWIVAIKLALHPLAVWLASLGVAALSFPMDPFTLGVVVLAATLPSASNVTMLAERYEADAGRIAWIVLLSTALAVISVPLLAAGWVPKVAH